MAKTVSPHQTSPQVLMNAPGSIFVRRLNYKAFAQLPRHKINSYHIKMEDDGSHGNDEVRWFILSNLSASKVNKTTCIFCEQKLTIYDRYPLIEGTFFLSPIKHDPNAVILKTNINGQSTLAANASASPHARSHSINEVEHNNNNIICNQDVKAGIKAGSVDFASSADLYVEHLISKAKDRSNSCFVDSGRSMSTSSGSSNGSCGTINLRSDSTSSTSSGVSSGHNSGACGAASQLFYAPGHNIINDEQAPNRKCSLGSSSQSPIPTNFALVTADIHSNNGVIPQVARENLNLISKTIRQRSLSGQMGPYASALIAAQFAKQQQQSTISQDPLHQTPSSFSTQFNSNNINNNSSSKEPKVQYINSVCMSCLEGWSGLIMCKFCGQRWDGSHLILGSVYMFDIFASQPCCEARVTCNNCFSPLKLVTQPSLNGAGNNDKPIERHRSCSFTSPNSRLAFHQTQPRSASLHVFNYFSRYSHRYRCETCDSFDHHFVKPASSIFFRL